MDYSLLDCQSTFCQRKGRLDWALECAKRSVTAAPSEFGTWAKLAEIYVGLEQWDLALLTLNSCPMFTYQDKDAPRMPEPARVLLPVLPESMLDEIDESQQSYDGDLVHSSLRKLHAAGYKGTFHKAYSLLTEITSKIGWDQLLKVRSQVFVMEEEYRSEKQTGGAHQPTPSQNASTIALHSPSPKVNGATPDAPASDGTGEEDEGEREERSETPDTTRTRATVESNGTTLAGDDSIEKPNHTITSEEVKAGNEEVSHKKPSPPTTPLIYLFVQSPPPPKTNTPNSTTSVSASVGSTTSSWSSTKTSASTPSGAPTWPAPNLKTRPANTANRPRSGRSWASWRSGCTISPRRSRRTRRVCA